MCVTATSLMSAVAGVQVCVLCCVFAASLEKETVGRKDFLLELLSLISRFFSVVQRARLRSRLQRISRQERVKKT